MDLLNSHPEIHCDDEILSHRVVSVDRFVATRGMLSGRPTYGFKLKVDHLARQGIEDPVAFLHRLHTEGWRIVHVVRRDVLRQAISLAIARQRRAFHHIRGAGELRPGPFRIDADRLVARMRRLDANRRDEEAAIVGLPHLTLCYEDGLLREERHQATLDRTFDFLGIERVPVTTRHMRTGTDRLADLVVNLEEIHRALRATEYVALAAGRI